MVQEQVDNTDNKCQNCCRITHLETGLKAQCTEHRERHRNQEEAFRILADRILQHYAKQEPRPVLPTETIRTYHGPDNRVKDHLSGFQQPYSVVMNDISQMIVARARAMTAMNQD